MKTTMLSAVFLLSVAMFAQDSNLKFSVSFVNEAGKMKSLNGVQGGPLSTNDHDADLSKLYKAAGITLVRFPYNDGFNDDYKPTEEKDSKNPVMKKTLCKLTLGDIFPDRKADPENPASYDFSDIDKYIAGIKAGGAEPVWQIIYDIGRESNAWLDDGRQTGKAIMDPAKWNRVAINTLRHFNNGWGTGHKWKIKYLEFMSDPDGAGGYDFRSEDRNLRPSTIGVGGPGRKQFMDDFISFIRSVVRYNDETGSKVKVLGPGLDADQTIRLIPEIMRQIGAAQIPPDVIIFSYRDYNFPQKFFENGTFIRSELDRMVLGAYRGIPIWNVEWNYIPPALFKDSKLPNEISAWTLSHNVQIKTLMQPVWEEGIVYRATRQSLNKYNRNPSESYFFNLEGKGEPLPAYLGWQVFDKMAKMTPVRLQVKGGPKDNSVTVLAAKSSTNKKISVLVSYWRESSSENPANVHYDIDVTSFYPKGASTGKLYVIDKDTKNIETGKDAPADMRKEGSISISGDINLWSVHFWEFER